MTQEARPETVQGDFTRNNSFEYLGVKARMERQGDKFSMTLNFPDGRRQVYPIDRTVGSRRIEQYVSRQGDQYIRLPLAYDLTNRRWMSLNGSFFYPDGENFFQHQAVWDQNCVFCHNVKAQPQMDAKVRNKFSTEVAELGIACGACHGAAAAHAEAASSPFTREWWRFRDSAEKQIVLPTKLTTERSMMICGHCHGQRVPQPMDRIQEILTKGDPFNAGDDLAKFYRPVARDTKIGQFSFAARFWQNGSPRLTAYEYQGILRSACFTKDEFSRGINCLSCHSMHEGDIKGQIKPENRTDKPCLNCHQQFAQPAQLVAHTGHKADSIGSHCYDCHMPRVVYGVMAIHRTHDITVPDASLTATQLVPNACNQCHLDKSVNWAIAESKRLWPRRFANTPSSSDEIFNQPEGVRALFAGDALTRAMAAEALGFQIGGGAMKLDANWAAPFLIEALNDNYPIVRFFAANGLAAFNQKLSKPDYLAAEPVRLSAVEQWWARYPQARQQVFSLSTSLRARRVNVDVEVGE